MARNSSEKQTKVFMMSTTTGPTKQVKSILKVAVLSEPYFPKQKLSVRFNSVVLQHMELDDLSGDNESTRLTNRS